MQISAVFKTDNLLVMLISGTRLIHLIAVTRHGSFGRAAESLGISQPALTKSIQGLENALGVKVLNRGREGITPTVFGDLVLERGSDLLHRQDEIVREIKLLADLDVGHVSVMLGPYPSVISGFAAVGRLCGARPKLKVTLLVKNWREVMQGVLDERADFGVAEASYFKADSRFDLELLPRHQARFFCRPDHPILMSTNITPAELCQYPWAATRMAPRTAQILPADCPAGKVDSLSGDFVPAIEINVPIQLAALATGSDVLVLSTLGMMEAELAAGSIAPLPGLGQGSGYGLFHLKSRSLSPAALALMEKIREVEAEYVQREAQLLERYP